MANAIVNSCEIGSQSVVDSSPRQGSGRTLGEISDDRHVSSFDDRYGGRTRAACIRDTGIAGYEQRNRVRPRDPIRPAIGQLRSCRAASPSCRAGASAASAASATSLERSHAVCLGEHLRTDSIRITMRGNLSPDEQTSKSQPLAEPLAAHTRRREVCSAAV